LGGSECRALSMNLVNLICYALTIKKPQCQVIARRRHIYFQSDVIQYESVEPSDIPPPLQTSCCGPKFAQPHPEGERETSNTKNEKTIYLQSVLLCFGPRHQFDSRSIAVYDSIEVLIRAVRYFGTNRVVRSLRRKIAKTHHAIAGKQNV
jgi:hypothetical protein